MPCPYLPCYTGMSLSGKFLAVGWPSCDLPNLKLCVSLLFPGSRTSSCWTAVPSGLLRRAGWCLTSQPPATTGWSTLGTTWACSFPWRPWMVSSRDQHLSSQRNLRLPKGLNSSPQACFYSSQCPLMPPIQPGLKTLASFLNPVYPLALNKDIGSWSSWASWAGDSVCSHLHM